MSIFKSPTSMAVLVAFFYILITWSLYVQWETNLEVFVQGAEAGIALDRNDPGWAMAWAKAVNNAPQFSSLLSTLLTPIPKMVSISNGGAIRFWAVALQGLLLGGLVYLSLKAWLIKRRTGS